MSLMFEPLRKYATFTGRARRSEYWLFTLFVFLAELVGGGLSGAFSWGGTPNLLAIPFGLAMLALFIPSLAVSFRRLHDTDRSAWWLLISFLPLIGAVVLFVFMVLDGTHGPNRFGPDPKPTDGETLTAEIEAVP